MTPQKFFNKLAQVNGDEIICPKIKLATGDILVAKVILWLMEQLPEDATIGDFEEVFLNGLWWLRLWGSGIVAQKEDTDATEKAG